MQDKKDILQTILAFAKTKEEIRLVLLEGSRANQKVKQDRFQDYDIAFFMQTSDIEKFKNNQSWLKNFGKVLFMQKPEDMELYPPDLKEGWFSFLILFNNGIRIDFVLIPLSDAQWVFTHEKLVKVLLDKDNIAPQHSPSDEDFYIKPLSKRSFKDCLNEFYFLYTYVHKGLLRKEALYVNFYLNALRENLFIMLAWQVGLRLHIKSLHIKAKDLKQARKGIKLEALKAQYELLKTHALKRTVQKNERIPFAFALGKHDKLLPYFLSKKAYKKILLSYHLGDLKQGYKTLALLDTLFFKSAKYVASAMDYPLPKYRQKVKKYCKFLESS